MSIRVYSEINLHITWHTKNSLPMITNEIESKLRAFLKNKIVETPGTYFQAIGGMETHLHIVTTIKPSIHFDGWMGQLKGTSSHEFGKSLQWQNGYGIVSFGTKDLKWVIDYVRNQREHHKNGTTFDRLEKTEDDD